MICPACNSEDCRRSRRRTVLDYLASVPGMIPWRCSRCGKRFRSRTSPFSHMLCAHCAICGNLQLKRIPPEHANSFGAPLWRILSIPAFRCVPCRNKFFTLLPLSKDVEDTDYKIAS